MAPRPRPAAALALLAVVLLAGCGSATRAPDARDQSAAHARFAQLPLAFEANRGQTDARVRYLSRGAGYTLFLTDRGTVLSLARGRNGAAAVLRETLVGARETRPQAEALLPGRVNVYRGSRSHTGIRTYERVRYPSVYPGIDAVHHGRQSALEYDFEIRPGADPSQIALSHSGVRSTTIARNGDLLLHLPGGIVREARPVAYQVIDGRRVHVDASYRLTGDRVGFDVGTYDRARKLVIDPVLSYSSYLGGSDQDFLIKIAVGSDRKVYVTGRTLSNDFPGGTRDNARLDLDAFVTKLNPDATRVYTSYVGTTGMEQAWDVEADSSGRAYIVGDTDSTNFVTFQSLDGCADAAVNSPDAFLVRLNASDGTLSYRTCLGGGGFDTASGLALRESGGTPEAYIVGTSYQSSASGFPQNNGFQTSLNGGVATWFAKVSFGSSVTMPYFTWIDGSSDDYGRQVAVDSSGNAYVAGDSTSNPLAGTPKPSAGNGVFVTKVNPATTGTDSKVYSTWIDGSGYEYVGNPNGGGDYVGTASTTGGIAVNSSGMAYVVGSTASTDLPGKVDGAAPFKYVGGDAGFIGVLGTSGSVARTVYIDGAGATHLSDVGLQEIGGVTSIYTVGDTDSGITGVHPLGGQSCADATSGHPDALIAKFADGSIPTAIYATCLGGTGDDDGVSIAPGPGNDATAWIIGTTTGSFPTVNPKQPDANAVRDGFIARIGLPAAAIDSGPADGDVIGSGSATFTFSSTASDGSFACSVRDGGKLVAGNALGPCSGAGTTSYSGLADGQHTFEVATVDAGGAESARSTRTFTVNSAAPSASYVIAPNPVLVGRPASFDASASTPASDPIVHYEWDLDGDGSFETDGGGSPTTTKTYTAAATVTTSLRVTDSAGRSGIASVPLRVIDSSSLGTQVGVSINKGAQYTNKPDVTLTIVAPASATALLISNDGGFAGALPQPVASQVKWRLDSSGPERLPKTVYLRFLIGTFASSNYTDDIILDERPPVVDSASVASGAGTATAVHTAKLRKFKVKVKAHDTNSGVGAVQITANKRKPGKLIAYKTKLTVKSATRPKFLRARDRAGNFSPWKKLR